MLIAAAAYCTLAAAAAVVIGRAIAHADRREPLVPQLDVPLWRGTDLEPAPCPECGVPFAECSCPVRAEPEHLSGAILALAYAVDETTARYWLSQCARRGADWQMQQELWDAWQAEQQPHVIYLDHHREDDQS